MRNHGNSSRASTLETLSTKLNRVSETAKQNPSYQFRTLAHLITTEMLEWSYRQLKKSAASGIDGLTAGEYEKDLSANLEALHLRLKAKRYRAQPLKRVYIQKEDGKQRPLSIPSLEDKIVQRAVDELLARVYENDFLPCSYGYRRKRSAHDAVGGLKGKIAGGLVSYVLDADVSDYFGNIVQKELMRIIEKRVADRDLLRLIGKWLKAGVIENGELKVTELGIYQGSVISPLLANIYLHEVLDLWVKHDVEPRLKGEMSMYRFADDFVACFQYRSDAVKFFEVLPKRFAKYGLNIHPGKTKLIAFGRFAEAEARSQGKRPETFNFLGFTYICSRSRKNRDWFAIKLKTMAKRFRRGVKSVYEWCRTNRHEALQAQWEHLTAVLRGHYQYYGRRTNFASLKRFYRIVYRTWWKWLSRRDRGHGKWMRHSKYLEILKRYPLPLPVITEGRNGVQLKLSEELV